MAQVLKRARYPTNSRRKPPSPETKTPLCSDPSSPRESMSSVSGSCKAMAVLLCTGSPLPPFRRVHRRSGGPRFAFAETSFGLPPVDRMWGPRARRAGAPLHARHSRGNVRCKRDVSSRSSSWRVSIGHTRKELYFQLVASFALTMFVCGVPAPASRSTPGLGAPVRLRRPSLDTLAGIYVASATYLPAPWFQRSSRLSHAMRERGRSHIWR